MLPQLTLRLHHLLCKNRRMIRPGNRLELPASSERNLKKVTIKLRGRNNRLVIGEDITLTHCEIRLGREQSHRDRAERMFQFRQDLSGRYTGPAHPDRRRYYGGGGLPAGG